jgi:hypothetical protein
VSRAFAVVSGAIVVAGCGPCVVGYGPFVGIDGGPFGGGGSPFGDEGILEGISEGSRFSDSCAYYPEVTRYDFDPSSSLM